jgi:hypothetical protein
MTAFAKDYYLALCCDFVLHSADKHPILTILEVLIKSVRSVCSVSLISEEAPCSYINTD